jgi:hypothetical protein
MAAQSVIHAGIPRVAANGTPPSIPKRIDAQMARELKYFTGRFKQCLSYCEALLSAYSVVTRVTQYNDKWQMVVTCQFRPIGLPPANPVGRPPEVKV